MNSEHTVEIVKTILNLPAAERQKILLQLLQSSATEDLSVVLNKLNRRERDSLSAIFERTLFNEVLEIEGSPTVSLINEWLSSHRDKDFEAEKKRQIARAITHFKNELKARLFTFENNIQVECGISTEGLPNNRRRFHIMGIGIEQRTIEKRTRLPYLFLEK